MKNMFPRSLKVFHPASIEGYKDPEPPDEPDEEPIWLAKLTMV